MLKFKNHFFEIFTNKHLSAQAPLLSKIILGSAALLGISCLVSFFIPNPEF